MTSHFTHMHRMHTFARAGLASNLDVVQCETSIFVLFGGQDYEATFVMKSTFTGNSIEKKIIAPGRSPNGQCLTKNSHYYSQNNFEPPFCTPVHCYEPPPANRKAFHRFVLQQRGGIDVTHGQEQLNHLVQLLIKTITKRREGLLGWSSGRSTVHHN